MRADVVDGTHPQGLLSGMSDGIIDLTQYLKTSPGDEEGQRGAFALWGADGERSRFALKAGGLLVVLPLSEPPCHGLDAG